MNALPAGCPPAGCIVPIAHLLAGFPVWTWPVLASAWLGGSVAAARRMNGRPTSSPFAGRDVISPGEAAFLGVIWPARLACRALAAACRALAGWLYG